MNEPAAKACFVMHNQQALNFSSYLHCLKQLKWILQTTLYKGGQYNYAESHRKLTEWAFSSTSSVYIHLSPHSHLEAASAATVIYYWWVNTSLSCTRQEFSVWLKDKQQRRKCFILTTRIFPNKPQFCSGKFNIHNFSDSMKNINLTGQPVISQIDRYS